ncbi:MAG: YdeI/OmpD-associated family protein [Ilumatobacteraceae bacterium]
MTAQRFRAEIKPEGGSAYIDLPFDVPAAFGTKGRVSLKGTIDGHEFTTSTGPRHGEWYIVVNRELRQRAGVEPGDVVDVVIDRDDAPRTVEAPEDLAVALADDGAAAQRWATMAYSHRKQYVSWVADAKRPITRSRRVAQSVEMIRRGERRQ